MVEYDFVEVSAEEIRLERTYGPLAKGARPQLGKRVGTGRKEEMKTLLERQFLLGTTMLLVELQWQPAAWWIGCYVKSPKVFYLCLLPCLPLRIELQRF